jgi:hypothetical protein
LDTYRPDRVAQHPLRRPAADSDYASIISDSGWHASRYRRPQGPTGSTGRERTAELCDQDPQRTRRRVHPEAVTVSAAGPDRVHGPWADLGSCAASERLPGRGHGRVTADIPLLAVSGPLRNWACDVQGRGGVRIRQLRPAEEGNGKQWLLGKPVPSRSYYRNCVRRSAEQQEHRTSSS